MVLYSAEGIPAELVAEIGRETYADGSYEMLDEIPQDRGMIQAGIDFERLDDVSRAACDNNPSHLRQTHLPPHPVHCSTARWKLSCPL